MSYETDTKDAYRNEAKAQAYRSQYIEGFKWARFTMWRQKQLITKFLDLCDLKSDDKILDIPCGTGYIGDVLSKYDASVVASDISIEMMELAMKEYNEEKFYGFIQADITKAPFPSHHFTCVIVLALMHRLPAAIRKEVLSEVVRMTNSYVIISYSVENLAERVKQWLLLRMMPSHIPAPASIPLRVILDEMSSAGLKIIKQKNIARFLSAKVVFLAIKTSVDT